MQLVQFPIFNEYHGPDRITFWYLLHHRRQRYLERAEQGSRDQPLVVSSWHLLQDFRRLGSISFDLEVFTSTLAVLNELRGALSEGGWINYPSQSPSQPMVRSFLESRDADHIGLEAGDLVIANDHPMLLLEVGWRDIQIVPMIPINVPMKK